MIIICQYCNNVLDFDNYKEHNCCDRDVKRHVEDLNNTIREQNKRLDTIEDKLHEIWDGHKDDLLEHEAAFINRKHLSDLWDAYHQHKEFPCHLAERCKELMIIADVGDLFSKRGNTRFGRDSFLKKIEGLLDSFHILHPATDEWPDYSAEEVYKMIKEERA